MKIYFAGSIRGGRDDAELYQEIIALLAAYGEVLTEHVGGESLSAFGEEGDLGYIYERDVEWVQEADVIVAEVSTPSLGVGYEIGLAESLDKRILCIYREANDRGLSAMIGGNRKLSIVQYETVEDIADAFRDFF